ncbi:MAG: hypothetical protein JNJ88_11400 [Planctomycetes bacterium]|nr:hypothetical protein [Planctomycetota bacterium]
MAELLKTLRDLQDTDTKRARCERDLQRIPKELQQRTSEVDAVRMRLERGREEVKRLRAEEKNMELEIRSRNEKLEKLTIQSNMARDSATLLATNHQIQTLKGENARAEDRALGLVDRIEQAEKVFPTLEAQVAAQMKELEKFSSACTTEMDRVKAELAELQQKRQALASTVPADVLDTYQKMLAAREGIAVCAVDVDCCSGCSMSVPPNDLSKIRAAKEIVRCKSCGRILYAEG